MLQAEETNQASGENVLKELHVSILDSSNVANAEKRSSCENRVRNAKFALEEIKSCGIKPGGKKLIYFLGSCSINQLQIEDVQCLAPYGIKPFRPSHHTITTQSVTMMLLVNSNAEIVYWRLWNAKTDGSTSFKRVMEFLEEASRVLTIHGISGQKLLYLDNAGAHRRALASNLRDKKHKEYATNIKYADRQNALRAKWQVLWAPSCTPESNMAEFFFRSVKEHIATQLNDLHETLQGPQWTSFVGEQVEKWIQTVPLKQLTLTHITDYLRRVIEVKGDLQQEAIRAAQFHDFDHLVQTIVSSFGE